MPTVKKAPAKKTVAKKPVAPAKKPVVKAKKADPIKAVAKKADGLTERQRRVYNYLKAQTTTGFSKHFPKAVEPKEDKKKPSEKATKLGKLIPSFGGYAPHLTQVMEIVLGEKIPGMPDASKHGGRWIPHSAFIKGACIVPVGNSNSHDYPIGKVAMVLNSSFSSMMRNNGSCGNNLTTASRELRMPTDAELRAFAVTHCERIITKLHLVVV